MARNKYVEDIRKITGLDKSRSALGPAKAKPRILGSRGIGYRDSTGQNSVGQSGVPGDTTVPGKNGVWNPPAFPYTTEGHPSTVWDPAANADTTNPDGNANNTGDLKKDGEYKALPGGGGAGSSVNPDDPNAGAREDGADTHDAGDVIDGVSPLRLTDSLGWGVVSALYKDGGTLKVLTGMIDCDSEKELELRLDGLEKSPEGFEDPDEYPVGQDPRTWVLGKRWLVPSLPGGGNAHVATAQLGSDLILSQLPAGYSQANATWNPAGFWVFLYTKPSASNQQFQVNGPLDCTAGGDEACLISTPNDNRWEADGVMQLIREEARWTYSLKEPEEDIVPKYTDSSHSNLDFCFGTGRTGAIATTSTGGYMVGETTEAGGPFTGTVRVFNREGKLIAYTDGNGAHNYEP